MGTQNVHNVPFLESAFLKKGKRKAVKRIKQFYKISKMGNKTLQPKRKHGRLQISCPNKTVIQNCLYCTCVVCLAPDPLVKWCLCVLCVI